MWLFRKLEKITWQDKISNDEVLTIVDESRYVIKTMVVCKDGEVVNITIDRQTVEQVKNFKYLGSNISEDGYDLVDVKTRIALAKEAFNKRKEF